MGALGLFQGEAGREPQRPLGSHPVWSAARGHGGGGQGGRGGAGRSRRGRGCRVGLVLVLSAVRPWAPHTRPPACPPAGQQRLGPTPGATPGGARPTRRPRVWLLHLEPGERASGLGPRRERGPRAAWLWGPFGAVRPGSGAGAGAGQSGDWNPGGTAEVGPGHSSVGIRHGFHASFYLDCETCEGHRTSQRVSNVFTDKRFAEQLSFSLTAAEGWVPFPGCGAGSRSERLCFSCSAVALGLRSPFASC